MRVYPDVSQSMATYARAGELIPGWTQLISRRADQFANGVSPVYAQRAKGSRFIDVDENEYIDWVNAVGAVILWARGRRGRRRRDPPDRAGQHLHAQQPAGNRTGRRNWSRRFPAGDGALHQGGGEACAVAVRIARGVTGRDTVLICGYSRLA
ncbi:MAG: hypothetical protein R2838_08695 [Caldilineaceae bacterium]